MDKLKKIIRDINDFPKAGIVFKDITTLLADGTSFQRVIDLMGHRYLDKKIDLVVGIEARGFLTGAALAYKLNTGIVLVRKPSKLPNKTFQEKYSLEYGTDVLEIHQDAIRPGQRVLITDDILATGGTIGAVINLVRKTKAEIVECAFLAELKSLKGREKLAGIPIFSLLSL